MLIKTQHIIYLTSKTITTPKVIKINLLIFMSINCRTTHRLGVSFKVTYWKEYYDVFEILQKIIFTHPFIDSCNRICGTAFCQAAKYWKPGIFSYVFILHLQSTICKKARINLINKYIYKTIIILSTHEVTKFARGIKIALVYDKCMFQKK